MRVAFLKEAREGQCGNQVVSQAEKSPVLVVMQLVIKEKKAPLVSEEEVQSDQEEVAVAPLTPA